MVTRKVLGRAVMRVDAKAEGLAVAVGGWAPHYDSQGVIDTTRSRWFSISLDRASAPWAFVKGHPSRAIDSLELLASLVA